MTRGKSLSLRETVESRDSSQGCKTSWPTREPEETSSFFLTAGNSNDFIDRAVRSFTEENYTKKKSFLLLRGVTSRLCPSDTLSLNRRRCHCLLAFLGCHLQEMADFEVWKDQLQQFFREVQLTIQQIPPTQLYSAVAVLLMTTVLILSIQLFKRKKSNTIVLCGLSGSGKTLLFYQLRDGSSHQGTVTSMDPNEGTFVLHSEVMKANLKPVHIVDVPGHSRLRPKLDEYLPQAAGLAFVVDALEFLPNCRAAAEYLYDILTKASIVKRKIPVLIVCNKSDKVTAHSKEFIRKQLEKEIEKLRASRTAVSEADIASEFTLGIAGEAFTFSHCQNKVTVAEASGLTGETTQVEQFIREHVKP